MAENSENNASPFAIIKEEANRKFDSLYGEYLAKLAMGRKNIAPELYEAYSALLRGLHTTLRELASSVDSLPPASPQAVAKVFNLVGQAVSESLLAGGIIAVTPLVRDHYMTPVKEEKRNAGIASGIARRKSRKWVEHASYLISQVRKDTPSISQERLAEEVIQRWKDEQLPPSTTTMKKFISELERSGKLPRRSK